MSIYKNHLTPTDLAKTKNLAPNILRCSKCKGCGLIQKKTNVCCRCLPYKYMYRNKYKYINCETCKDCYGLGVLTKEREQIINYESITN